MNTLRHNRSQGDDVRVTTRSTGGGVLRAAARVQRPLLITGAALGLLALAALVTFRLVLDHRIATLRGLTDPSCPEPQAVTPSAACQSFVDQVVGNEFTDVFTLLHLGCLLLAIGLGALVGAPVFAREFEQRTQVLCLTQSVGRTRWWTAKVAVVLVPLVVLLLAVGAVAGWAFDTWPYPNTPMASSPFLATSISPAVVGVLAAALGMTAGVLWRSTVGAIVLALVLCAGAVFGAELIRPHLAAADRLITGPDEFVMHSPETGRPWTVGNGYVDAAGNEVHWDGNCSLWNEVDPAVQLTDEMADEISRRCYEQAGIAGQYTDSIPESRFWMVRTLWSGGLLLLSGGVLLAGLLRIRRRVL